MSENIESEFSSEYLIKFIENDALKYISNINITSDEENSIDFKHVHTWYLETEKLIRILANILPATMAQPINQLRYAGHHISKAACNADKKLIKSNLTEGYKHCKRAYYDSLDLYVYHMSDIFRSKVSLLAQDNELDDKIIAHIESFTKLRLESESRIDYYASVSKTLLEGLSLIAGINKKLKESGVTDKLLSNQSVLIENEKILTEENRKLKQDYNHLDLEVKTALEKADKRQSKRFNIFFIILAFVTAFSILFQGYFTEKLITSKSENLLTIENLLELKSYLTPIDNKKSLISPTDNKKKSKGYKYIQNIN
jgi:hypothetical protein